MRFISHSALVWSCMLALGLSACGGSSNGTAETDSESATQQTSDSEQDTREDTGQDSGTHDVNDSNQDTSSITLSSSDSDSQLTTETPSESESASASNSETTSVDTSQETESTDTTSGTASETDTTSASETESHTQYETYPDNFDRYTVDDTRDGPSFVSIGDVTGDGIGDLVVSYFGSSSDIFMQGYAMIYSTDGNLSTWNADEAIPKSESLHFVNAISLVDIDNDSDLDMFVPSGFLAGASNPLVGNCGGLDWYENEDGSWIRHRIVHDDDLFYHHVEIADLDGDGFDDFITVGEKKPALFGDSVAQVQMYLGNDTTDRFAKTPQVIGNGLGSIPRLVDLDGDDDLDIASAEYFYNNGDSVSFAWFEQLGKPTAGNPSGSWTRHVIAGDLGPSIQLSLIPDFYGDGVLRAVGANHTNTLDDTSSPESQVVVFEDIPADPKTAPWTYRKISEGIQSRKSPLMGPQGAPGVFGQGDVDNDGDIDLVVSGDGDDRIFVIEQTAPGAFVTHVLADGLGQCGVSDIVDIDGDGHTEFAVTSYEAGVVYLYRWKL